MKETEKENVEEYEGKKGKKNKRNGENRETRKLEGEKKKTIAKENRE